MEQLCGDIGDIYLNADTNEKVYAKAGPEFRELQGMMIEIVKGLYGFSCSGERWHAHFSDTLRDLELSPTRFNKDIWIRLSEDTSHYEYLCTHVDDFMIVSTNAERVMESIQAVYTVKSVGPPKYYLGNDIKRTRKVDGQSDAWCIYKKYSSESKQCLDHY